MRIDLADQFHGAALPQVAEHERFTAINRILIHGERLNGWYQINDDAAVCLKYASNPEYQFNFHAAHIADGRGVRARWPRFFFALVCVRDREICALAFDELTELIGRRADALGRDEDQCIVNVRVEPGRRLRVYVDHPGQRGAILGQPLTIPRNRYPSCVFGIEAGVLRRPRAA